MKLLEINPACLCCRVWLDLMVYAIPVSLPTVYDGLTEQCLCISWLGSVCYVIPVGVLSRRPSPRAARVPPSLRGFAGGVAVHSVMDP